MNTAASLFCQTGGRRKFAHLLRVVAAVAWLLPWASSRGDSPEPPVWERELGPLRVADAAIAILPPARATEAAEAGHRLGELFRRLSARYPREAAVRKAAGDHFWRTGDAATAASEWEAAQSLDPTDADTASALGSARLREGRTRLACEQFRRAVVARPDVARYHYELGNALFLFRHQVIGLPDLPDEGATLREALAQFRSASDRAEGNAEFARAYAETFYGVPAPDWHEARAAWEHVRALSPDAPDFALSHLARISLKLGEPAEAERYLALIRDPRFARMQAMLRRQAAASRLKTGPTPPP